MRVRTKESGQAEARVVGCVFWFIFFVVFVIVAIAVGGTWRTRVSLPPGTTLKGRSVPFKENLNARHWLMGLIKGKQPDLQTALSKHMRKGDVMGEISITTRHTIVDHLLTGITLGIYSPVTVTVEGNVITAQEPG